MLIQQMMLILISGNLFFVVVSALHRGMTFASNFRNSETLAIASRRLAIQLREDAHEAVQATAISPTNLELRKFDQSMIRYKIEGDAVHRLVIASQVGGKNSKDKYAIPLTGQATFSADSKGCSIEIRGATDPKTGESSKSFLTVFCRLMPASYAPSRIEESKNE